MASSNLNDVFQFLNTINPIVSDISKAGETVKKSFDTNYMQRIYDAAKSEREKVKKHPSREVTLLRAFKNYADYNTASRIDSMIETINIIQTIMSIQHSAALTQRPAIESASKDDKTPSAQNNSFAEITSMLMALSLINKK